MDLKKDYSIRFYTGGIDPGQWHELSTSQKKTALKKHWYIRWSYRNPKTGLLEKQSHIKQGVNRLTTFYDRMEFFREFKKGMVQAFEKGINPFNLASEKKQDVGYTVEQALTYALDIKKQTVSIRTFNDYKGRCTAFMQWLNKRGLLNKDIGILDRRAVSDYLDDVLKKNSPRTRNNVRGDLSALFTILADKFIIDTNFIKNDLGKVRTVNRFDRRFSKDQMMQISKYLNQHDTHLLLFIKIVAYNFLRPVEVCRLRVSDVDLISRTLYFDQKTKLGKTKHIPDIYFNDLKNCIEGQPGHLFIFTPHGKPADWTVPDSEKRNYFSRKFKSVKKMLNIPDGFGMYSFRHSFITATYMVLKKEKKMGHTEAVDFLMKITGHDSHDGILKYIHANDADRPDDWSELIDMRL